MILWIAGRMRETDETPWEVMGVFDSEEKAAAACTDWNDFIGPIQLNERQPDETSVWEGTYFPVARAGLSE